MSLVHEKRTNVVYVQCPSCSYRHGPIERDNAKGIVGCPMEKGIWAPDKAGKMDYTPHRYNADQLSDVKLQLL